MYSRKAMHNKKREDKSMRAGNNKLRKALMMVCCALVLVAISVGATLAYLTDTETVTNTFTAGHVDIKLDEAKVDDKGKEITGANAKRVRQNEYHLIPGHTYDKDPTITIEADSETCYVVAKIDVTGMKAANNPLVYEQGGEQLLGFGGIVNGGVFDNTTYGVQTANVDGADLTMKGNHTTYGGITLTQKINKAGESYTFYIYFEKPVEKNINSDQTLVLFEELKIPGKCGSEQKQRNQRAERGRLAGSQVRRAKRHEKEIDGLPDGGVHDDDGACARKRHLCDGNRRADACRRADRRADCDC